MAPTLPEVEVLAAALLADPGPVAASLRDPEGPLAFAWPQVSGPLGHAPVWVLRAEAGLSGRITWDGVLAWTAPATVDGVVLRLPAEALGGRVEALTLDGVPLAGAGDLFPVDRPVRAGATVALHLAGVTVAGKADDDDDVERLFVGGGAATFASWLPLPTPCDARGACDRAAWVHAGDPGSHEAMVFVAELATTAPTALHPGRAWPVAPGRIGIAAIGVRELPVVLLGEAWKVAEAPGTPLVRAWSPVGWLAEAVAQRMRASVDDFSARYGPLPSPRLEAVLSLDDDGSGVELPGIVLLSEVVLPVEPRGCLIVAHEAAHQWFYGEVGSDTLAEPWVDESIAEWAAIDHCRREGLDAEAALDGWEVALAHEGPIRAADPSAALGDDRWGVVYLRGFRFFEELAGPDPAALDAAMRQWLGEQRWRHATGADQLRVLEAHLGPAATHDAWTRWMDRSW